MRLHQIQVIGRIGQDAKIIDHQGRKFLAFSLAVDESYKDGNGTKVERVVWYDCNSDQERLIKVATWLTKGREVLVEGKPSVRIYDGQNGKPQAAIRIQINTVSLGHSPNDNQPATAAPAATVQPIGRATAPATTATAATPFNGFNAEDESTDLPF